MTTEPGQEKAGWPVVVLFRLSGQRLPKSITRSPGLDLSRPCFERYLPESAITGLVEALEEIVRISNDNDLTNSAAQDRTEEVASAALSDFKQEVE